MVVLDFLKLIYGEEDLPGSLVLWTSDDKRSYWFNDLAKAAVTAEKLSKAQNCFLGMALQDPDRALEIKRRERPETKLSGTRGMEVTARAIPGLWMDLDVAGPNHAQENLPGSIEEAVDLLESFPLRPTIIVHTGGGVHAHWLFNELFELEEQDERDAAKQILTRLQYTLQQRAEARGWKLDSTYDLARVLRPPGTLNHKSKPPQPVTVLSCHKSRRYELEDFDQVCLAEVNVRRYESENRVDPNKILAGVPQGSRDTELFRYASSLRSRGIPRTEAQVLVLQAARACSPPFPDSDALAKLESAWKYKEGADKVKLVEEAREATQRLEDMTPDEIFTDEVIGSLALIKDTSEIEWSSLKARLKGKVNLNDLTKVVNKQVAAMHNLRLASQTNELPLLDKVMPDIPLKGLQKPPAWSMTEHGVWQETEKGPVCASPQPIILTERRVKIEGGDEKWGLSWYDVGKGKWDYVVEKSSVIFNATTLCMLADKGICVSSTSAKDLVRYLTDLRATNLSNIPLTRSTGRMGWISKEVFLPGVAANIELDPEDGMEDIMGAYSGAGSLEEWMDLIRPLREIPMSRFILAAGFAAPLLEVLRERVFIVHLYGDSGGGKTSVIKAALSIWGDPDKTLATFNSTKVFLERVAALYCDLPLGVDEKQMVADQQNTVDALVYILGSGQSRGRGTKGGGVQRKSSWRTIVLTSGEHPLTSSTASTGLKNRAIETYDVGAIPDEGYASELHQTLGLCHGTAGPAFIVRLIAALKDGAEQFTDLRDTLFEEFLADNPDSVRNHVRYVADVCVGDYLSSLWIWGLEEAEAAQQAHELGLNILARLESRLEIKESVVSYNYFLSWFEENSESFFRDPSPSKAHYGFREGDYLYVLPNVFEKAMKSGGFHAGRILRDWATEGKIRTYSDKNKTRYKIRKSSPLTHTINFYIAIQLPVGEDLELN